MENKLDRLFKEGVLVDVRFTRWLGNISLDPEDLGVNSADLNGELYSLGVKRLLPVDWRKSITRIEGSARSFLAGHSFPFPVGAAHFVPIKMVPVILDRLTEIKNEWDAMVDTIEHEYGSIQSAMIAMYEQQAPSIHARLNTDEDVDAFTARFVASIRAAYPQDIRSRFSMRYNLFTVTTPNGINEGNLVNISDDHNKILNEAKSKARERINKQVDEFTESVVAALRHEIADTCNNVLRIFEDGRTPNQKSVDKLRRLISKFKTLNFLGDREIDAKLASVQELLQGRESGDFRSSETLASELRDRIEATGDAARRTVSEAEIVESFGGAGRRILRGD